MLDIRAGGGEQPAVARRFSPCGSACSRAWTRPIQPFVRPARCRTETPADSAVRAFRPLVAHRRQPIQPFARPARWSHTDASRFSRSRVLPVGRTQTPADSAVRASCPLVAHRRQPIQPFARPARWSHTDASRFGRPRVTPVVAHKRQPIQSSARFARRFGACFSPAPLPAAARSVASDTRCPAPAR